jgi:hypothetical protein
MHEYTLTLKCVGLNALWIKPSLTLCHFVAESVLCSRIVHCQQFMEYFASMTTSMH